MSQHLNKIATIEENNWRLKRVYDATLFSYYLKMKLRSLCDAVFDAREMQISDFENGVLDILRESKDDFERFKSENNFGRLEKLSSKLRKVLVILHLFPVELKIAMTECSYGTVLRDFLALYLNIRSLLSDTREDSEAFINDTVRETFLILGSEDEASIWMVLCKSSIFENLKFLEALVDVSFHKTQRTQYTFEQYVSLVGVLYKYFSVDENAKRPLVLEAISNFRPPKGVAKYLYHHFPDIHDFGSVTDIDVHKKLFRDAQPKSFVCDLAKKIGLQGADDLIFTGWNTLVFENAQSGDAISTKEKTEMDVSETEKCEKVHEMKSSHKSKKKKKKKRSSEDLRESSAPKKLAKTGNPVLDAFYAGVTLRDPVIVLQRIRV